jgi:hypothetical protein
VATPRAVTLPPTVPAYPLVLSLLGVWHACRQREEPRNALARPEEPAKVEELAKEEEQGSDYTTSLDSSLDCQLGKAAEAVLRAAGAEGLVVEWHAQEVEPRVEEDLSSAVSKAKDLRTHPRRAGYVC